MDLFLHSLALPLNKNALWDNTKRTHKLSNLSIRLHLCMKGKGGAAAAPYSTVDDLGLAILWGDASRTKLWGWFWNPFLGTGNNIILRFFNHLTCAQAARSIAGQWLLPWASAFGPNHLILSNLGPFSYQHSISHPTRRKAQNAKPKMGTLTTRIENAQVG